MHASLQSSEDERMRELQELQQRQLRKQQAQEFAASLDMSDVQIQLSARSVRIGSYRSHPAKKEVKLSITGLELVITCT